MIRILPLLLLALAAWSGEPTRAEREAAALRAVLALPPGEKREAGERIVREAWNRFRADAEAARSEPPADADEARRARLAELAARNAAVPVIEARVAELGLAAALPLIERGLERWPLDTGLRLLLARARHEAGDAPAAIAALDAALLLEPELAPARELRGRLLLARDAPGDRERAAGDLAPSLARLLAAAAAAESGGEREPAAAAWAALEPLAGLIEAPDARTVLTALRAGAEERAGRDAEALALWREAAAAGLEQPRPAPRIRALVRRLRADAVAPAIAAADTVVLGELSPSFPEHDALQDTLFRALLRRGRLVESRDAARALLDADAAHPLARLIADGAEAGLDPRRLALLPPVVARLRLALAELGPRFPVLHALDAALTELAGDAAGAAAALDPLLAGRPDDRDARWQRARLRLAAGDHAGAIADADLLLAQAPDDVEGLGLRGRARAAAGDQAGALADIDRVMVLAPGPGARFARARVRLALADAAGCAADLAALIEAVADTGGSPLLVEAADLAGRIPDEALATRLLERASSLGNAEATLRLRRLRR
jgi:hypothetical protein